MAQLGSASADSFRNRAAAAKTGAPQASISFERLRGDGLACRRKALTRPSWATPMPARARLHPAAPRAEQGGPRTPPAAAISVPSGAAAFFERANEHAMDVLLGQVVFAPNDPRRPVSVR